MGGCLLFDYSLRVCDIQNGSVNIANISPTILNHQKNPNNANFYILIYVFFYNSLNFASQLIRILPFPWWSSTVHNLSAVAELQHSKGEWHAFYDLDCQLLLTTVWISYIGTCAASSGKKLHWLPEEWSLNKIGLDVAGGGIQCKVHRIKKQDFINLRFSFLSGIRRCWMYLHVMCWGDRTKLT